MPTVNCNIPVFECFVRSQFLYDGDPAKVGSFEKAAVFSVSSVPGHALGFQVMLENGAVYDRLPVTALTAIPRGGTTFAIFDSQIWDCPSAEISVIEYDFLKGLPVDAHFPVWETPGAGTYFMTFDWHGDSVSDGVGPLGHKCAHLIALNSGDYVLYPNNRLCFHSPAWVTKPWSTGTRPDYKINTTKYVCEARRRITSDAYVYEIKDGDSVLP